MNGASDGSGDDRAHLNQGLVVPAGAEVRGRIRSRGDVLVEGRVEGDLEARRVEIASGGEVIARVTATRLDVYGGFIGVANATDAIVVHAGATASGRLSAPRVEISPEALVDEAAPREAEGDDDDGRPREEQFDGAVTERLQLGAASLARLRAPAPTAVSGSGPASTERRVPAPPRPPTRAKIALKPRGGP